MNYLDLLAAEIQREAEPDSSPPDAYLALYRQYAVLLLAKGDQTTDEDVHNAWAAWATEHEPTSDKIVPFKELSLSTQRKDDPYAAAIGRVARRRHIDPLSQKE